MKAEEAKAFSAQVQMNKTGVTEVDGLQQIQVVGGEDKLRARLAAWQRAVDEARLIRGGEDGEIWNIQAKRQAEKDEKARIKQQKEQEKLEKEKLTAFTLQELYRRILRVEKLSEMVKGDILHDGTRDSLNLVDMISAAGRPMSGISRQ